ncbi:MAG TPA: PQQ-binding-like beta-propeller repeat protein, partial [Myxococcota bacterium]
SRAVSPHAHRGMSHALLTAALFAVATPPATTTDATDATDATDETARVAWQVPLAAGAMRPCVVDGDSVVQALASGDVVSVARATHAVQWRAHLGSGGVHAAPAVLGDVVVAGAFAGPALAFAGTGAVRWRAPIDGVIGSPVQREHTIFVGTIGGLVALDDATGYERGRFPTVGGVPAVAVDGDRVVFASFTDDALIAVDVDEVGAYTVFTQAWRLHGPALAHDKNGAATNFAGFQAESIPIVDGVAFVPTNVAEVWAVDVGTGQKRWGYEPGGSVVNAPAVARGLVFIVASNGSSVDKDRASRVVAVDAGSGVERWAVELPHVLAMGGAVVVDGVVALATDARALLGFHAATGARIFTVKLRGAGWWTPCADGDGTIYVGDDSGALTAVRAR